MIPAPYASYEKSVTVGCVNFSCTWGDKAANLDRIKGHIREPARQGIGILAFPELALSGYECDEGCTLHRDAAETIPGPATEEIAALTRELGLYAIVGMPERDPPLIFLNTSLILKSALSVDNDEALASLMAGISRSKYIGNYPIKIEPHNKQIIAKLLPIYWDNKVGMTKEMPLLNGVIFGGTFIGTYYHLQFGRSWAVKIYCIEYINSKIVISSDGKILEMVLVPGVGPVKFIKD